jgi:hypothetical protein
MAKAVGYHLVNVKMDKLKNHLINTLQSQKLTEDKADKI